MTPKEKMKIVKFLKECARSWNTEYSTMSKFSIDLSNFRIILEYIPNIGAFFLGVFTDLSEPANESNSWGVYLDPAIMDTMPRNEMLKRLINLIKQAPIRA